MKILKAYIEFMKTHRNELKTIKLTMLIIVNAWLFIIFWKILLLNDVNLINNNQILVKASSLIQPVLNILGLDILTPNMLKMCVITGIIVISNLAVLYINQMIGLIGLAILGRYSYKSYTNYLINSENISYMGFEDKNKVIIPVVKEKVSDSARIVIENTTEAVSHTHWGTWIVLGTGLLVCFGLLIWSHNNLSNHLVSANQNVQDVNTSLKDINNHVNERITRNVQQIDYNNEYITKMFNNIDKKVDFIDNKIINLENTVQTLGANLVKVNELGNANVLKLSQQSLSLSHKANEALLEISQATGTVEATTIGLSKVVEIITDYKTRLEIMETRMDSITGNQTPRSSMSYRNISNIQNIMKKDE